MLRLVKNALVEKLPQDQGFSILSPAVGTYFKTPEIGAYLRAGSPAGLLKILNSLYHLRIPEDVSGFVYQIKANNLANPVEFKQELFSLIPSQHADLTRIQAEGTVESQDTSLEREGRPAGAWSIFSPTEGIFYQRPNPNSAPYVQVGEIVTSGAVLGLVEVMKSFTQIRFIGPDFPEKAKVIRILVSDAVEVKDGQVLYWLEPV